MKNEVIKFSIGDVEKLTGIKQHILRYWEDNIPLLSPEKDEYGRRVYFQRDLDFVFRLKYLINEKKFTVEGAGAELLRELENEQSTDATQIISKMRNELINIFSIISKNNKTKNEKENDETQDE
ncbi:MAG: MerR family transcriptional regulator [Treponemataceae bacterium]